MRPVTLGDLCAAARVLLDHPDHTWPQIMADLLAHADHADQYRQTHGNAHLGNGTLMGAALSFGPSPAPATADPRHLAALGAVIAAVIAHGPQS